MKDLTGSFALSLALICCLVSSDTFAGPYKPSIISDVSTIEHRKSNLRLNDRSIELSISYQEESDKINQDLYRSYNPEHIDFLIKDSWTLLKSFMTEYRIPYSDCRLDYNLNIFVVSNEVLYDTSRFADFFSKYGEYYTPGVIFGFYDPTLNVKNNSAILLTNVSVGLNDIIFIHEMSHYWFARLCVETNWPYHDEEFSVRFQEYYKARR